jgi:ZIP family zinc transporter
MNQLIKNSIFSPLPDFYKKGSSLWLGIGVFFLLAIFFYIHLIADSKISNSLHGGLMAAGATCLGALPILFSQEYSKRTYDILLGFGAGVMLAACFFSLIMPAIYISKEIGLSPFHASKTAGVGIILGASFMLCIDRLLPHEHFFKGREGPEVRSFNRIWLFVIAITLHNLPEGLAIGLAFSGNDLASAKALTTGISIQDIPEGMVVALALRRIGYGRITSVLVSVMSGLVEPVAALIGAVVIGNNPQLMPLGLSLAAGAMLFVISNEIIPESHRDGKGIYPTVGLILGFVLMMILDNAL